jgi:glycosyltransferase involved in cell wall biosynthesis
VDDAARRILIVSYHFPPDRRVGAVRPAKFAKYLARFGWKPTVLTIGTKYIDGLEPQRVEEVQTVPIVRTPVWPTIVDLLVRVRNRFLRRPPSRHQYVPNGPDAADTSTPRVEDASRSTGPWAVARKILHFSSEFPDTEVGWVIPAVWRGYWLIKRERIPLVMVSSPPRSSVFIGMLLSWLTGARLITDLRDPWMHRDQDSDDGHATGTDRVKVWLERRLMERSHDVITTADRYTDFLQTHYRFLTPDKFHTITNGYDAEDFERVGAVTPDPTFTLSYLGTFYWTRTPRPLLAALSELVSNRVIPRELLRVNFIGTVTTADGETVEDLVREYALDGIVAIQGVIPYHRALAEMKRSAVLVLLAFEAQYYGIPAKTFEYIGIGRPILCLGDKGATADLIRRSGAGLVVDPRDITAIATAIERLFVSWQNGEPMISDFDTSVFERSRLTRELIDIIA